MTATHPQREHRWQASLAILVAAALFIALPDLYAPLALRIIVPVLELGLVVALLLSAPYRHDEEAKLARWTGLVLIAIVNIANAISLVILVSTLLRGGGQSGAQLIRAAGDIWLTNVIVFGLWYWEIDRGGPGRRQITPEHMPDFLFPQMSDPKYAPPHWVPRFVDYLYVAFTNAAAFSPTDTMPLSATAKMLMLVQSLISMLTLVLVAARAVNVLA